MNVSWQDSLAALIENRSGVAVSLDRTGDDLTRFVQRRTAALSMGSPEEYVQHLAGQSPKDAEFSRVLNLFLNGYTLFYRDLGEIALIREILRRLCEELERPITIWSAGCASGEEAYSLSLVTIELGIDAVVVGTDIREAAIAAAGDGLYAPWSIRNVPPAVRDRYFHSVHGKYRLVNEARDRVQFIQHNLVDRSKPLPRLSQWDLIVCQRVLMYFSRASAERVVGNLLRSLTAGGSLVVGATESLYGFRIPAFRREIGGRIAYGFDEHSTGAFDLSSPDEQRGADLRTGLSDSSGTQHADVRHDVTYGAALRLLSSEQPTAAIPALQQIVSEEADNAVAAVTLGNVYLRQHDFSNALAAYALAQTREPLLPETHYFQGVVYRKLGDADRARDCLRRTLFLEPAFWPAAFLLAQIYEASSPRRAREMYSFMLSILPTAAASCLFRSGVDHVESAALSPEDVERVSRRQLRRMRTPA